MYSRDEVETVLTSPTDRTDDEAAFKKLVEEDAANFRPLGEKIHSYVRRSGQRVKDPREMPVGKAKELPSEDEEGTVVYEVYHASILFLILGVILIHVQVNWGTPGFLEFHRRMQVFILLYIEAGSYIQEDEEKWEFVTL
jgi:histone acetyltransferase 1